MEKDGLTVEYLQKMCDKLEKNKTPALFCRIHPKLQTPEVVEYLKGRGIEIFPEKYVTENYPEARIL